MYGTVAHLRAKPNVGAHLSDTLREFEQARVPGSIATYVYQMDSDPNEYYLAVVFTDKAAYVANANSPEQDARYRKLLELLERPPEWHDGEILSVS